MASPRTIAVVGAGFSGVVAAANILGQSKPGECRVVLIERRQHFARGVAYSTWDDNLVLNVPAGNMSAFPGEPGQFVNYCKRIDPAFSEGSFVARRIYGDYLESVLESAEQKAPGFLQRIRGDVDHVCRRPDSAAFTLRLRSGGEIGADSVVLALGHFAPDRRVAGLDQVPGGRVINDPWDFHAIDKLPFRGSIVLLGSGHTAVDVLFRLTSSGIDGRRVHLVSRRGMIPHGHRPSPRQPRVVPQVPGYIGDHGRASLRWLVHCVRAEASRRMSAGEDWRDVLNELRTHTPLLWGGLADDQRRVFLSRILPYWDVHRHRLAPVAARRLDRLVGSGTVSVIAGRAFVESVAGGGLTVSVIRRNSEALLHIPADAVVNCTGPSYDVRTLDSPLLKGLLADGLVRRDSQGLGIDVSDEYEVIDSQGHPVRSLLYVGPMLKARYWEAIAVPELRLHAFRLAASVLGRRVGG